MRYSEQEKIKIVCHFQNGATVQEICQQYGISRSTLYRWVAAPRTTTPDGEIISLKEIRQLQRKVERLQAVVQILKAVNCTVSSHLHDKFAEMEKLRGQFEDYLLCDALDVPRGSFYNYVVYGKKENTWYHKRRKEYSTLIQKIFDENRQIVGAKKIYEILKKEGHHVSEAFVRERMQELGLSSVRERSKAIAIYQDRQKRDLSKKDLLQQRFQAAKPNQVWVSDVTCYDNAVAESFFATLKREELYRRDYTSEKHLTQALASYIDYYNSKRPHKTLGYLTPQEKEDGSVRYQRFKT